MPTNKMTLFCEYFPPSKHNLDRCVCHKSAFFSWQTPNLVPRTLSRKVVRHMYIGSCFIYECGDIRRSIWRPKCPSRGVSGSLVLTAPLGTLTLRYYFSARQDYRLLHISYFIRLLIFPLLPVNFRLNVPSNGLVSFPPFYLDEVDFQTKFLETIDV